MTCEPGIFLNESWLCPDCDWIGSHMFRCAKCGNEHGLLCLSRVLNRDETKSVYRRLKQAAKGEK